MIANKDWKINEDFYRMGQGRLWECPARRKEPVENEDDEMGGRGRQGGMGRERERDYRREQSATKK